jgi:hypothetical protein
MLLGDNSASNRKDPPIVLSQHTLQRALFNGSKARLAIEREDFGERHSHVFFDLAIELNEGRAQFASQHFPECRFSGASQTDQRNA